MSTSLGGVFSTNTNAAIVSYDTEVKQAYQGAAYIRNRIRVKTGVTGQTYDFRTLGAGIATQHTSSELITPADYAHVKKPATLTNWRIGDYTDLFDQAETNIDERAELAQANGKSVGRAEDQLIIDALDAATSIAGTVDEDLGGTNSLINATKLRRAKRYLMAQQARGGEHTILVNAYALEGALSETEITSADYQTFRALVDANLDEKVAFGFKWMVIEDRDEGGLPTGSASIRLCFAFDRSAVGLAVGIEPRTYVDWVGERLSYLSQAVVKAGSTVIEPLGVVEVQSYEA